MERILTVFLKMRRAFKSTVQSISSFLSNFQFLFLNSVTAVSTTTASLTQPFRRFFSNIVIPEVARYRGKKRFF